MIAAAFLADLRSRGVHLDGGGDRLCYDAPAGVLTDSDRAAIVTHKAELLALLAAEAGYPQPATWLLFSHRLGEELWLARDLAAFERVRDELGERPVVLGEELDRLRPLDTATLGAVLEAKVIFGPGTCVVDPPPGDREEASR